MNDEMDAIQVDPRTAELAALAEWVHARSGVIEYDAAARQIIWTDRVSSREYGASAIIADHVVPWFGRLIVDLVAPQMVLPAPSPWSSLLRRLRGMG